MSAKYKEYKQLNLPEIGREIGAFWQKQNIFEKSIKTREGKPAFTFYEGPPSANGLPGIHQGLPAQGSVEARHPSRRDRAKDHRGEAASRHPPERGRVGEYPQPCRPGGRLAGLSTRCALPIGLQAEPEVFHVLGGGDHSCVRGEVDVIAEHRVSSDDYYGDYGIEAALEEGAEDLQPSRDKALGSQRESSPRRSHANLDGIGANDTVSLYL